MCYIIVFAFIGLIITQASSWPSPIECPFARRLNEETAAVSPDSFSDESTESLESPEVAGLGLSDDSDKLDAIVRNEEQHDTNAQQFINKGKREVCEQLMEQIRDLPCDNPVVLTCGNNLPKPYFPCSGRESSRESPESEPQDLPVDSAYATDDSPQPQIPTRNGISQKDKGLFEGLLRFATVVNHIDTFITEKGKGFIRGLNRMVESEENASF